MIAPSSHEFHIEVEFAEPLAADEMREINALYMEGCRGTPTWVSDHLLSIGVNERADVLLFKLAFMAAGKATIRIDPPLYPNPQPLLVGTGPLG